jgi:hypothetical protein
LQVTVHDHNERAARLRKPGRNRPILAMIAIQPHATNPVVSRSGLLNLLPGIIVAEVVDKDDLVIGIEHCIEAMEQFWNTAFGVEHRDDNADRGFWQIALVRAGERGILH